MKSSSIELLAPSEIIDKSIQKSLGYYGPINYFSDD